MTLCQIEALFFLLINQNLGASFCVPKIDYQSQKGPVLPPVYTWLILENKGMHVV